MTQGFSRSPRGSFLPPTIRYGGAGTSSGGPNAALWEYGGYGSAGGTGARNSAGGTGNDASYSTGARQVPRLKDRVKQWSFDEQGMAGEPGGGA